MKNLIHSSIEKGDAYLIENSRKPGFGGLKDREDALVHECQSVENHFRFVENEFEVWASSWLESQYVELKFLKSSGGDDSI